MRLVASMFDQLQPALRVVDALTLIRHTAFVDLRSRGLFSGRTFFSGFVPEDRFNPAPLPKN